MADLRGPRAALLVLGLLACGGPGASGTPADGVLPGPGERDLSPRELLGKRLFEDPFLSEPPGQACASCHRPDQAFTGNAGSSIAAVAVGSRPGVFGTRNPPTVMYASFSPPFGFLPEPGSDEPAPWGGEFLDGRAADLVAQAQGPFLNPKEMNNPGPAAVVAKLKARPYAPLFEALHGAQALEDPDAAFLLLARDIAAYEGTARFHPFSSRFDAMLRGEEQLDAQEARGFELFKDPKKGNCLACHAGTAGSRAPADWLFTDFSFDALGIPRNPAIPANADPASFDLGLCSREDLPALAPPGYQVQAGCGSFKVPTLRNVALTAPYMHNGYFLELKAVVQFYVTRDLTPEAWYPADRTGAVQRFDDLPAAYRGNVNTTEAPYDRHPGEAPRLAPDEVDAVVAFLRTLTDR